MLQKLKAGVSCKLTYALLLCAVTTSQSFSQSSNSRKSVQPIGRVMPKGDPFVQEEISISLDEMNKLSSIYNNEIAVYPIKRKEITVFENPDEIKKLQFLDDEYEKQKAQIEILNKSKTHGQIKRAPDPIDDYYKKIDDALKREEAISTIINKIDAYLTSKEKHKKKYHLLRDAQDLADEYMITINISEREKLPPKYSHRQGNLISRIVKLYEGNKSTDISDIEIYKAELLKLDKLELKKPKELIVKENLEKLKNTKVQRQALIADMSNASNKDLLVGKFKTIDEKYLMCENDTEHFSKNELIDRSISRCLRGKKYLIMQNVETNDLYYLVAEDFTTKLKNLKNFEMLKSEIAKYGYSVNENGSVKTKMATVSLGEWLINKLKNNPNYLKQLDADYSKIAELYKSLPAHSKTLDRFIGLYRVQLRMSTSDIDSWRASTKKADSTFKQIYKLKEKYEDRVWDISSSTDNSEVFSNFMDNLLVSKNLLGI